MDIVFILVEPAVPENIGAACRAIKTMGFSQLRLVNPKNHQAIPTTWLAHGTSDILNNAQLFDTLESALSDVEFTAGTTAKKRRIKLDYFTPKTLKYQLLKKATTIKKMAVVFGREESGLTNNELKCCDPAVTIPLAEPYPSTNLAQTVMILSYELSDCKLNITPDTNNTVKYPLIKSKVKHFLANLALDESHNLYDRIMERIATAHATDLNLILSSN